MAQNAGFDLDEPKLYSRLDPSGLRDRLRALPRHCELAWRETRGFPLLKHRTSPERVVIGGMGGSAIAGDLLADLASLQATVPILVVRDHRLPFVLDERTLFIACSYSGNTEETLSLFRQATQANARVMAISGGGTLADLAREHGVPLLTAGISGEPRSVVGFNLMLLLGALERLGLVRIPEEEVNGAVASLLHRVSGLREDVPTRDNPAKQLAVELRDKLILVYGSGLYAGAARRWKSQFNENAKAWAFAETIPELLHNSVEAFGTASTLAGGAMALLLRPNAGEGSAGRHYSVVAELLQRNDIPHRILQEEDGSPLGQLLGMVLLGDYVSYYLALLRGVDPSPTPAIVAGKALLAGAAEPGRE